MRSGGSCFKSSTRCVVCMSGSDRLPPAVMLLVVVARVERSVQQERGARLLMLLARQTACQAMSVAAAAAAKMRLCRVQMYSSHTVSRSNSSNSSQTISRRWSGSTQELFPSTQLPRVAWGAGQHDKPGSASVMTC